jgi:hypothetical protein
VIPPGPDWQPGDPLYPHAPYRNYLFNFRDDSDHECRTPDCTSGDAASWPTPRGGHALSEPDEITKALLRIRRAEAAEVSA